VNIARFAGSTPGHCDPGYQLRGAERTAQVGPVDSPSEAAIPAAPRSVGRCVGRGEDQTVMSEAEVWH